MIQYRDTGDVYIFQQAVFLVKTLKNTNALRNCRTKLSICVKSLFSKLIIYIDKKTPPVKF